MEDGLFGEIRRYEQVGMDDSQVIARFYQGDATLRMPGYSRLIGEEWATLKAGEARPFTGQTLMVRVA